MIVATWNVQGIKQKAEIIAEGLSKLNIDNITFTETKKNCIGTKILVEYIYIHTGLPEEKKNS